MIGRDIYVVVFFFTLCFDIYLLLKVYVHDPKACPCAINKNQIYIRLYLYFVVICCSVLCVMFMLKYYELFDRLTHIFEIIIVPLAIAYTFISLNYVREQKKAKCVCSKNVSTLLLHIISIMMALIFSSFGFIMITVFVSTLTYRHIKKNG